MADGASELDAIKTAYEALKNLDPDQRRRAIGWLVDTLEVESSPAPSVAPRSSSPSPTAAAVIEPGGPSSAGAVDVSQQTPRQFIASKRPANTAERLACLAYYSAYARSAPTFKTPDLVALNTEAAGPRIGNPSRDVDNCERGSGYLTGAGGGAKQLSTRGEALVTALPDRDAVKEALEQHPHRRRARKATTRKAAATKKAAPAKKSAAKKTLPRP